MPTVPLHRPDFRSAPDPDAREPRWASELARLLNASPEDPAADSARVSSRVWVLAFTAIARYARIHASRHGWLGREDLEDLVSDKTLEFVRQMRARDARSGGHSPGEIAAYLSRMARNGVVDAWRRQRVRAAAGSLPEVRTTTGAGPGRLAAAVEDSSLEMERRQIAAALAQCLGALDERSQRVWILRVLLEWSSGEVAAHPEVGIRPAHVDVVLQRARERIRRCLASRGFHTDELPTGCFAAIWARLSDVAGLAAGARQRP